MSRYTGPQHSGAARELRQLRRAEAEQRHSEEHARDAARRRAVELYTLRRLTGHELEQLITAAITAMGRFGLTPAPSTRGH